MTNPNFIVVKVVRDNKDDKDTIREETIKVENILSFRKWFNKSSHIQGDMVQVTMKSSAPDEDGKNGGKIFKLLLNENYDDLNAKINAVKVSA